MSISAKLWGEEKGCGWETDLYKMIFTLGSFHSLYEDVIFGMSWFSFVASSADKRLSRSSLAAQQLNKMRNTEVPTLKRIASQPNSGSIMTSRYGGFSILSAAGPGYVPSPNPSTFALQLFKLVCSDGPPKLVLSCL